MTAGLDLTVRRPRIESLLSREFTFLLNNWVLCSLLFFILVATTFPLISEALTGEKVTVGPPFYKAWVQPLGVLLLVLMGVGTNFGWKKTSPDGLRKAFRAPLAAMGSAALLHFAIGRSLGFPAVVWSDPIYSGALGAGAPRLQRIQPGHRHLALRLQRRGHRAGVRAPPAGARTRRRRARARRASSGGSAGYRGSFTRWCRCRPSRAAATADTSATSASFSCSWASPASRGTWTREASLFRVRRTPRRSYTLSYVGARMEVDNSKRMVFADVDVYKNGKLEERLSPGKFIYKKQPDSPTTAVAIGHGLRDDVYLIVGSINPGEQEPRGLPAAHQPARVVDMDRLHRPHRGQHRVHVAAGRVRRVARLGGRARSRGHGGERRLRDHARGDASGASADDVRCTPGRSTSRATPSGSSSDRCAACAARARATCSRPARARPPRKRATRSGRSSWPARLAIRSSRSTRTTSAPRRSRSLPTAGVFRAIWVVPVAGIGLGAFGLARLMRRWRGGEGAPAAGRRAGRGRPARWIPYEARLDDELKDLDD